MTYKYIFDKDKCWWKSVCGKYGERDCNGCCIRYMKMHYLVNNALLTDAQQYPKPLKPDNVDLDAFMELLNIKNNIYDFVKEGKNLLIYSEKTGNGKTQWSLKMMMKYLSQIWSTDSFTVRGLFVSVARLCSSLKYNALTDEDYLKHIKDNILEADLVIWDDIGLKSLTPYEHDYLYCYINMRIEAGKSNIFTSNLVGENLKNAVGDRLYSRIMGSDKIIEFMGEDKRGTK